MNICIYIYIYTYIYIYIAIHTSAKSSSMPDLLLQSGTADPVSGVKAQESLIPSTPNLPTNIVDV